MMVERGVVIVTAESMEALELKYLELLALPPDSKLLAPEKYITAKIEWDKQIKYSEAILKMMRQVGDVLIDEIDTVLNVRRELNYTVGGPQSLPEDELVFVVKFFRFFEKVPMGSEHPTKTLYDFLLKKIEVTPTKLKDALDNLAYLLINHPESPIRNIVEKKATTPELKKSFSDYLLGRLEPENEIKFKELLQKSLNKEDYKLVVLLKGEVSNLCPATLNRNPNENFGFSHDPSKEKIAIPYNGHNNPSEKSQFKSPFETVNYTIPLYFESKEIPISYIQDFVRDFRTKAQQQFYEKKDPNIKTIGDTLSGQDFLKLTNLAIEDLDTEDQTAMTNLQETFKTNDKVLDYILAHQILPRIQSHQLILRSNAQNHASQYRTVQGCTGTPWNIGTFPTQITFNQTGSKGTDGQTLNTLIKKKTPVHVSDARTIEKLLDSIFKIHKEKVSQALPKVRAIIDVGALFRQAKENEEIAKDIALYFKHLL